MNKHPKKSILNNLSIKTQIILIVLFSIFIIGSFSLYFIFKQITTTLETNGLDEIKKTTLMKASAIEKIIEHNKIMTASLATNHKIIDYVENENQDTQNQYILDVLQNYKNSGMFYSISILDINGKTIISTDETLLGQNYSFREYFQKAMKGTASVDILTEVTSEELGYYFSNPIQKEDGLIIGVVVIKTKPQIIDQFLVEEIDEQLSDVLLTDDKGLILFSKKTSRIFRTLGPLNQTDLEYETTKRFLGLQVDYLNYGIVQQNLKYGNHIETFEIIDRLDDEKEILVVVNIDNAPLFIILEIEKDKFISSLDTLASEISLIDGITLIILFFIIYLIVSKSIKPLKNIEEFAVNISNGDYNSKIELNKSVGKEFFKIAHTLEYMVDILNSYKKETEQKIATQTKKIKIDSINLERKQEALINVLEDVDQEKQISEKLSNDLEKFKLASDYATDMIFITNPKGVLLYANTATETITGYTQKYLLDEKNKKPWYELITKKMTINSIINELIKTKKSTYREIDILTEEKNKRVLGLKMSPITNNNNEVIFLVGIGRDITKEKEIDKSKSEFVSVASHQLRTPLSTINWYTELLLSKDTGHLSKEQEEYVEEIRKDTKQMNKLVESLLNVSRIDMGTVAIEPEKVNIIKIAESAIKEFRPQMERHKFKFTKNFDAKLPKTMMLDKQLTFMIFQNLISNSVKYTPDKGKITINIKRKNKNVEIIVSDSGIGIPKKDQSKIFTKLYRASNAKIKHVTGVGLGLYIIKSFLEKTGCKIWFKSKIKKGTTFYVNIPIKGMKKNKRNRWYSIK